MGATTFIKEKKMIFFTKIKMQDEHGNIIAKGVEGDEQLIAKYCIEKDARVLELGARYGTITYQIAQHAKHVVTVEPDDRVWDALDRNLKALDNVTIFKGFLSNTPQVLKDKHGGYGTWSEENSNSKFKLFTLADAERASGGLFDTLVADCEGCLPKFIQENPDIIAHLRTVIYERDRPENSDYAYVEYKLASHGFKHELKGFQNIWTRARTLPLQSIVALQFTNQNRHYLIYYTLILLAIIGISYCYCKK